METGPIPAFLLVPDGFGANVRRLFDGISKPETALILDDTLNVFWPEKPRLFSSEIYNVTIDRQSRLKSIRFYVGRFSSASGLKKELEQWASFLKDNRAQNEIVAFFTASDYAYVKVQLPA